MSDKIKKAVNIKVLRTLVIMFVVIFSGCKEEVKEKTNENFVYESCLNKIKPRLKAPSSAVFASQADTYINQKIKSYPNDGVLRAKWLVKGYVDAQNSFSAQIRTHFTCEFRQWKTEITFVNIDV